ncbi:MAG: hypothetical protein EA400_13475 [Chromatiaceae bacterium]|nr:MAG: hypothetical protein EA400_13475 [Chromatiaceae bacterium]
MTDIATNPAPVTSSADRAPAWRRLLIANAHYVVLYLCAIVLVAITDSNPQSVARYWEWFVPVVALASILDGWRDNRQGALGYLIRQLLHWGALMLVILLLFLPEMQYFLNAETDGFVVAYLLGLTALLAGVHSTWKMGVFGAFLLLSGVAIGFLSDNALLLLLIGVGLAGLAMTLFPPKRRRT